MVKMMLVWRVKQRQFDGYNDVDLSATSTIKCRRFRYKIDIEITIILPVEFVSKWFSGGGLQQYTYHS